MAIDVHERGNRPEPGLGLALLAILTMVLTTVVLYGLIYVLMLGVTATSAGRETTEAPAAQESPVTAPVAPAPK